MSDDHRAVRFQDGKTGLPRLFSRTEWDRVASTLKISERRKEVVKLVMCGMRDKQIAQALGLSVRTVREHLTYIFRQLGVHDRVEVILFVFARFREL